MSKFCTVCGSALVDGHCPNNCPANQEVAAAYQGASTQTNPPVKIDFNTIINNVISLFKYMLTAPVDTLRSSANQDVFSSTVILIVLKALLTGVLMITGLKEAVGNLSSLLGLFGSSSPMDLFSSVSDKIPYGTIFGKVFAFSLVELAGLIIGIYVIGGLVLQGDKSFKKAVQVVGLTQVVTITFTVVALILAYIKVMLGIGVIAFGGITATILYYQGAKSYLGVKENKVIYVIPASYIIMAICCYLYITLFLF